MKRSRDVRCAIIRRRVIVILVFLLCSCLRAGFAQGQTINLNDLIQETQKRSDRVGEMSFTWWIPLDYWRVSLSQNPSITAEQIGNILNIFRPYTLIAVVDGKISSYAGVTYKTEAETRSSIQIKDKKGNVYLPLSEEAISVEAKSFLASMKPALANALGSMGQNMNFFVFPGKDKDGQDIADARKEGAFSVILGERELRWTLPLSSLLPLKTCPTCNEKLSGSYKFCPWDGTKLE